MDFFALALLQDFFCLSDPQVEGLAVDFSGAVGSSPQDGGLDAFEGNHPADGYQGAQGNHACVHLASQAASGQSSERDPQGPAGGKLPHEGGIHNQEGRGFQVEGIRVAGFLVHGQKHVRLGRLGIVDLPGAEDDLRLAGPAPGFGPVALGLADELAFVDSGGFGQDHPGGNDPLSPRSAQSNLVSIRLQFVPPDGPDHASRAVSRILFSS